jgi:hypothetical protein
MNIDRWTLINALSVAAHQYEKDAAEVYAINPEINAGMQKMFLNQAADCKKISVQLQQHDNIILIDGR